jgi:GNAT superfamily N-acetyltransferase
MTIDLRFATAADIPALVGLGRDLHVDSRYGWMVYSASHAWRWLEQAIQRKDCCVIVAVEVADGTPGDLIGFLIGAATEYPFANDFVANIEFFYLVPARRRGLTAMKMLTAFRRWATNRGVAEIALNNRYGTNERYLTRLFAKLGMPAVGGVHAAWVQDR